MIVNYLMRDSLVIITVGKIPSFTAAVVRRDCGLIRTLKIPLASSRECSPLSIDITRT